jgi:hypothetical protein
MEIQDYINHCRTRLAQIDSILDRMEKDNIPKTVSVWEVLREKKHFWLSRIEACGQTDPGNGHSFNASEISMN